MIIEFNKIVLIVLIISGFNDISMAEDKSTQLNVLGTELSKCCDNPKTGFFRDGYCRTNQEDVGTHVVCAILTDEFLK
jgi:uncharacterized protein (DUF2237 family)